MTLTTFPMHMAPEIDLARQRAEAEALHAINRLRVAQEQLLEYAVQKEIDARSTYEKAEKAGTDASVLAMLKDTVDEAAGFCAQQRHDVETEKRRKEGVRA